MNIDEQMEVLMDLGIPTIKVPTQIADMSLLKISKPGNWYKTIADIPMSYVSTTGLRRRGARLSLHTFVGLDYVIVVREQNNEALISIHNREEVII